MPLPTPVERQREVVCLAATGHQVVLGTAGSGKTTMAILRAAYLANPELPGGGPTLLLTFNRPLGAYIRSIAGPELASVQVEHFHRFARGYLNHRGLMGQNEIAQGRLRDQLVTGAVSDVESRYKAHPFFRRPVGFFAAELSWLAQHGVTSSDEYIGAERTGRSEARLERNLRPVMWEIREAYARTTSLIRSTL